MEQVIQAAQTAPRGSTGGPDSIELDILTHPLLRMGAAKYREAGAAERAADPAFAYLDALRTVIQQFADGDVPEDMAMATETNVTGLVFTYYGRSRAFVIFPRRRQTDFLQAPCSCFPAARAEQWPLPGPWPQHKPQQPPYTNTISRSDLSCALAQ